MGKKRARFDWSADPDDPALRAATEREPRSVRKDRLAEIHALVLELVELPRAMRDELPLEDGPRAELERLADTPPSPARKRQMNYVKRLLVDIDVDEVRQAMQGETPRAARQRHADRWRTRLLDGGDEELSAFVDAYGQVDRQHLRAVLRQARKGGEPARRQLFDALVQAIERQEG